MNVEFVLFVVCITKTFTKWFIGLILVQNKKNLKLYEYTKNVNCLLSQHSYYAQCRNWGKEQTRVKEAKFNKLEYQAATCPTF